MSIAARAQELSNFPGFMTVIYSEPLSETIAEETPPFLRQKHSFIVGFLEAISRQMPSPVERPHFLWIFLAPLAQSGISSRLRLRPVFSTFSFVAFNAV
jgi:hypothetical protein